jgi:hypothetical protein
MRGSSTGDPASHRTQDKRSHPASGAQAGTGRSALRPETVAEMRGASEKRPSAAIMLGRRLRIQRNLGQRNKPQAAGFWEMNSSHLAGVSVSAAYCICGGALALAGLAFPITSDVVTLSSERPRSLPGWRPDLFQLRYPGSLGLGCSALPEIRHEPESESSSSRPGDRAAA